MAETGPLALFRADASPAIGAGHVMRCMALSIELQRLGWRAEFAVNEQAAVVLGEEILSTNRFHILADEAEPPSTSLIESAEAQYGLLIVDHYDLGASYETSVRRQAPYLVAIDDLADRPHDCDVLIDPSPGRQANDYASLVPEACRLMLGADYALLRPEFAAARPDGLRRHLEAEPPERLLVAFGMTDPDNITRVALEAICQSGLELAVDVVLGDAAPHLEDIRTLARDMPQDTVLHASPPNIANLMVHADLAIGAVGGSALERCCLALPSIALSIAGNQNRNHQFLQEAGAIFGVNGADPGTATAGIASALRLLIEDGDARRTMAASAAQICDGHGAVRAALGLVPENASDGAAITSRPVTAADSNLLFQWQTEPDARTYSRDPTPPTEQGHADWMVRRLAPQDGLFEIVECDGNPCGVVRLDRRRDSEAALEISILIAAAYRGRGIGRAALRIARRFASRDRIRAYIHPENTASLRIFKAVGYRPDGDSFLSLPN